MDDEMKAYAKGEILDWLSAGEYRTQEISEWVSRFQGLSHRQILSLLKELESEGVVRRREVRWGIRSATLWQLSAPKGGE